ncbi:hypothetical protein QFC21_000453 [Naganishia friedmannii]|uniref:Uncharacterized protein n=1 Tax=Naganishia friedmannii TaxID=89922 RepID=A0ACC2WDA8_9TREE|nr:hypothetical protein QFC21_000453 [Naganishia friedmannii]
MLSFSTLLLRAYYNEIGWNEDNLYANINRSSSVPPTLSLQISKAPTDIFYASYALDALPQLNGGVSYITSSIPLKGISPSRTVPLHSMVDHFRVFPPPKRPLPSEEEYLAGDLVIPARDYLLYSRLHFPTLHLSALATTKLNPGWQASLMFIHSPATGVRGFGSGAAGSTSGISESGSSSGNPTSQGAANGASSSSSSPSQSTIVTPPPPPGNVILSLQQDTGRYSTEYTYSATDGMLGFRGLYNFGLTEAALTADGPPSSHDKEIFSSDQDLLMDKQTRIDEEEAMEGGLRGRFSAGGEIYFSRKQRSLGVSTGLRFTTIPPTSTYTHSHHPPSPPTTLTLLYNPLMGFLSTAYSAQISPHLALSSRYGVNVYSYESDLCVGGEWWIGSGTGKGGWRGLRGAPAAGGGGDGVSRAEAMTSADVDNASPIFSLPTTTMKGGDSKSFMAAMRSHIKPERNSDRDGVLKAKISGNGLVSFLYESRIRKCLVSVGVVSDFSSRSSNPVKTIGLEVQYFSD